MPSRTTWFILIPTLAVSGLLLAIGVGSAWYVHRSNHIVSDSLVEQLAAAQSAERLVLATREMRLELTRFSNSTDVSHFGAAKSWFEVVEAELPNSQLNDASGDPRATLGSLHEYFGRSLDDVEIAKTSPEVGQLIDGITRELLPTLESRLKEHQLQAREMSHRNQLIAQRIGIVLVALGTCGAVAGVLVGFGIAGSIHRSLVQISIPVQNMAGHLNEVVGPIVVEANADLSGLDESLRKLAEKTADVVQRLQVSVRQSVRREQLAAVGQLAAGLAHELRNPLMSVKLILQVALERQSESIKMRDLEIIQDEITRLERMLQTFLDFARPPRPHKTRVDVNGLVHAAVEVIQVRAAQQQVQLHVQCDSHSQFVAQTTTAGSSVAIEADEMQLRQLLLNLLLNALDALPCGGNVWIAVRLSEEPTLERSREVPGPGEAPSTDRCVRISVIDDGAGIAPDVRERLFEPFVSTKTTGIGLGLSICRQIVEAHEGWITATNLDRGGAEFLVSLPRLTLSNSTPIGFEHERSLAIADSRK